MPKGTTPLDLLRAIHPDRHQRTQLRPGFWDLLQQDEAKRKNIRTHDFLATCFEFDPISGRLRWKEYRPRVHFNDSASWRRWETRCAGMSVQNPRTISVTYRGRNDTLSPSKIAAVLLTGRDYDEIRSVRFRDGDKTNLSRSNLLVPSATAAGRAYQLTHLRSHHD